MQRLSRLAFRAACAIALGWISPAMACDATHERLGVARVVEIDATGGPLFGRLSNQPREKRFLAPGEVVLTFDDGPMPGVTRAILDILDQFCTKATFFAVGQMAVAYPVGVREIVRRGHTLGTHTWSHPINLRRLAPARARDQIESGFAAVALAAGAPIAPFFRFFGLNDSRELLDHLASRDIAAFTVDVVSNDSYIVSPERLIARTLSHIEAENGGIVLFHDIKPQTARALPTILAQMKARGFSVVHMRAKQPFKTDEAYLVAVRDHLAERRPLAARSLVAGREADPDQDLGSDRNPTALIATEVVGRAPQMSATANEPVTGTSHRPRRQAEGRRQAPLATGATTTGSESSRQPPSETAAVAGAASHPTPTSTEALPVDRARPAELAVVAATPPPKPARRRASASRRAEPGWLETLARQLSWGYGN